jgi:hypothetical protein
MSLEINLAKIKENDLPEFFIKTLIRSHDSEIKIQGFLDKLHFVTRGKDIEGYVEFVSDFEDNYRIIPDEKNSTYTIKGME